MAFLLSSFQISTNNLIEILHGYCDPGPELKEDLDELMRELKEEKCS